MTGTARADVTEADVTEADVTDTTAEELGEQSTAPVLDVSVVICAYTMQRWSMLCDAVASVESQERAAVVGQVDVVVVVDHDEDLLAAASARWPQHTVVANRNRRGLSGARNTGVDVARGEVVAFLDDDAEAHPLWLASLLRHFDDPEVGGVGGRVDPWWDGPPPGWLPPEFGWVVGCSYTGQPRETAEVRNPIGANMAFRRDVLDAVGAFRDGIGRVGSVPLGCEETELSIRVRARGRRILHDPAAVVRHHVPAERASWRYFVRRCWAEGVSKALVVDEAGAADGLSAERTHLASTLPRAVGRDLHGVVSGPRRSDAMGRAAAAVVGVGAAGAGFVRGAVGRRVER